MNKHKQVEDLAYASLNSLRLSSSDPALAPLYSQLTPPEPKQENGLNIYIFETNISNWDSIALISGGVSLLIGYGYINGLLQGNITLYESLLFWVPLLLFCSFDAILTLIGMIVPKVKHYFTVKNKAIFINRSRYGYISYPSFYLLSDEAIKNKYSVSRQMYHHIQVGDQVEVEHHFWKKIPTTLTLRTPRLLQSKDPATAFAEEQAAVKTNFSKNIIYAIGFLFLIILTKYLLQAFGIID